MFLILVQRGLIASEDRLPAIIRHMTPCKNCNEPLEKNYCPQCGQKNVDLERPLRELLAEVLRETFDLDGRAARTLKTLFTRPGRLTTEFLAGRRRLYTPPFRLYIVISVLFFVVAAWVTGYGALLTEGQTLETDAAGQARFVAEELPRLMFVLLPVFALLLKIAFRQRLYFDHLIHSLHLHSAAYVVFALMLPLEQASNVWLMSAQIAFFVYLLAYLGISLRRVYGASRLATGMKAIGVSLAYMTLLAISFEGASRLTMPESAVPFLTD